MYKRVCVFGAEGRTGIKVVEALLERGHEVVASVYTEEAARSLPEALDIRVCDVLNYESVIRAVKGADAVISVVGHLSGSDKRMQTKGIENIIRAMNEQGIKRVVSLTGTGVRIPRDRPSLLDRVLNSLLFRIDPDRIRDGIEHAEVLERSDLDWTIIRVLKLGRGSYRDSDYALTLQGPAEALTPREKVAQILVDQLESDEYVRKMPIVSG